MEKSRDAARRKKERAVRKREQERLAREASIARCIVCGEPVGMEDRCSDGNYLHRKCGYATSQQ